MANIGSKTEWEVLPNAQVETERWRIFASRFTKEIREEMANLAE